jgi:hypothetical protein
MVFSHSGGVSAVPRSHTAGTFWITIMYLTNVGRLYAHWQAVYDLIGWIVRAGGSVNILDEPRRCYAYALLERLGKITQHFCSS